MQNCKLFLWVKGQNTQKINTQNKKKLLFFVLGKTQNNVHSFGLICFCPGNGQKGYGTRRMKTIKR